MLETWVGKIFNHNLHLLSTTLSISKDPPLIRKAVQGFLNNRQFYPIEH